MRKITFGHLIVALFFIVVITVIGWLASRRSSSQDLQVVRSESARNLTYFHEIDLVARLSGQTDLRKDNLAKDDIEVRLWNGFGLKPLEGISLRRISGQWSAIHVKADNYFEPGRAERKDLPRPKSGWDGVWGRLITADILTLPDSSTTRCQLSGIDGMAFVVEINSDMRYRSYAYLHPDMADCKEATQMMKIFQIVFEEFGKF